MPEQTTQTFENVSLYLKGGMGGIIRTDVKSVTIKTGVKYAQYDNAIEVRFLEPRKRKERGTVLTYKPFIVVLSRENAIDPDASLVPMDSNTPGVTMRKSRYSSCDSRWESDFLEKLAVIPVLFSATGHDSEEN